MNVIKYKWIDSTWEEVQFFEKQLSLIEFKRYVIYSKTILSPCELTVWNHVTGEHFRDDNWVLPSRSLFSVKLSHVVNEARWKELQKEPNWNNILNPTSQEEKDIYQLVKHECAASSYIPKNTSLAKTTSISTTTRAYCRGCGDRGHLVVNCPYSDSERRRRMATQYSKLSRVNKNRFLCSEIENPKGIEEKDFGTPEFGTAAAHFKHCLTPTESIIPMQFRCNACNSWLKHPIYTTCCYLFRCRDCIQTHLPCPLCKSSEFQIIDNKRLEAAIQRVI